MVSTWLATVVACASPPPTPQPGPYDSIEPSRVLALEGLTGAVDVVRDELGVPHVRAITRADAYLAHGYVTASDRWVQLDLLRHVARGQVAELYGALDERHVDLDLAMRMHRFAARAEAQVAALRADGAADATLTALALDRYAAGVNAWLAALRAGEVMLDPAVATFVAPETIAPWTAEDSVAIGLLHAWAQSYGDAELALTAARQAGEEVFAASASPERRARARAFDDLFPRAPIETVPTIDGWPGGGASARSPAGRLAAPKVPADVLARARVATRALRLDGLGLGEPGDGGNAWVIAPSLGGGAAIVASDPHLALSNPAGFHVVHLSVPEDLDVAGAAQPGVPGVVVGHTATVAWGAARAGHDVVDFFLEELAECATGLCVRRDGRDVALETWSEIVRIGANGTIVGERHVTYHAIPEHGPLVPVIVDHRLAPPAPGPALSVRYTGHAPTRETRAILRLDHATTTAEAIGALYLHDHGAQSWVVADREGHIGWTTMAQVPVRSAGCRTWDPITGTGTAPWFVLPGDGSCTWQGPLDPRRIPHAIDPTQGFLVAGDADPVGETFDGDPLDGPHYAGHAYGPGLATARATRLLADRVARGDAITADDLAALQADTASMVGERLRPFAVAAATQLLQERATPGTHPDLAAFAASLDAAQVLRLTDARDRLLAWTLATPAVGDDDATRADAIATTLFAFWQVELLRRAFGDELALLGAQPSADATVAAAIRALEQPSSLHTGTAPGHPDSALLCDVLGTPAIETCRLQCAVALVAAVAQVELHLSDELVRWQWGFAHGVRAPAIVPNRELDLPGAVGFVPRPGDLHAIAGAAPSVVEHRHVATRGAALRTVITLAPGEAPAMRLALPGGQIFDSRSPHHRDLLDDWAADRHVAVPFTIPDILAAHEERWLLHPPM